MILKGWLIWNNIRIVQSIDYKKVVIVLTGNNEKIDQCCLNYIEEFMRRKYLNEAILLHDRYGDANPYYRTNGRKINVKDVIIKKKTIETLYKYYNLVRFYDNLVFTYTDTPKDNYLGRYLRETDIDEEDAVCLALYHLRCIPEKR